jgi:hypothetical protein
MRKVREVLRLKHTLGMSYPDYTAHFKDPAFKRHNGIDAKPHLIDTSYPVYCPVEGFVVEYVDYQQNGGGNEIYLISKQKVQMFDQLCYARIILCHAEKILVPVGYEHAWRQEARSRP